MQWNLSMADTDGTMLYVNSIKRYPYLKFRNGNVCLSCRHIPRVSIANDNTMICRAIKCSVHSYTY